MSRKDGYRIKGINATYELIPYIMPKRYDANNYVTLKFPYEPMHKYVTTNKKEGFTDISYLSLIIASYVRSIAKYPFANRFIVNKKIYARDGIWVAMIVLREDGDETFAKICFEPTDTIYDVSKKMSVFIEKSRKAEKENGTDKLIKVLLSAPGVANIGVGVLKFLDKHGWLSRKMIYEIPFHAGMTISQLASLRCPKIYHHIYEFGTNTMVMTMGSPEEDIKRKGENFITEKVIPIGITMDERVGGGREFVQFFNEMMKYIKNPEMLENPPEEVVKEDFGKRRNKKIYKLMEKEAARRAEYFKQLEA